MQEHGCMHHQTQQQFLPPGHQAPQLITHTTHTCHYPLSALLLFAVYIKPALLS
ncbi:hypothetical protein LDENG_00223410 [Lucifuga dentata]|nr:hypothetical protein LDENG_00223410 [Lucifuga dentata]